MGQKALALNLTKKKNLPKANALGWRPRSEAELMGIPNCGHTGREKKDVIFTDVLNTSTARSDFDVLCTSARSLRTVLSVVPYEYPSYPSAESTLGECGRTKG